MTDFFISLVNMSITASWLILAVIALRLLLKRAPKSIRCLMWALVGFKLVCPASFESVLSLIPSPQTVSPDIVYSPSPAIESGIPAVNGAVNTVLAKTLAPSVEASVNPMQVLLFAASILWVAGLATMLVYALISYLRLRKRVGVSLPLRGNILLCDAVKSPFILGVIKPKIYLPSAMPEEQMNSVIAHEAAHLRRRDHWWKPLGFLLLSVYWFNPLCWVAYWLLCKDIELACDERVIKDMDVEGKKSYSQALLSCSVDRRSIAACPLAFGEVGVKERIKGVLNYKKPAFWVIIVAVIACAATAVCLMTSPKAPESTSYPDLEQAVSAAILSENSGKYYDGECAAEGHIILSCEQKGDKATAYCLADYANYGFENGCFTQVSGSSVPAVYTFELEAGGGYTLVKTEYAQDGSRYAPSIKKLFPKEYASRAISPTQADSASMDLQLKAYAQAYLTAIGRSAEIKNRTEIEYVLLSSLGVSAEVSNKLDESLRKNGFIGNYPYWVGTREQVENGVRFVYETSYEKGAALIEYRKYVYGSGSVADEVHIDARTGEVVSASSLSPASPEIVTTAVSASDDSQPTGEIYVRESSEKKAVKLTDAAFKSKNGFDVYGYGVDSVQVKVKGEYVDAATALNSGALTPEKLVSLAKSDAKKTRQYKDGGSEIFVSYDDGGSTLYPAGSYSLLKMNKIVGVDGDYIKDIYIGTPELDINNINR